MTVETTTKILTATDLQEFGNRLLVSLSVCGVKKTTATREAISHLVRFIAETGGPINGLKASKAKKTPKILSTRERLVAACLKSGFANSESAAKNYADIALLVFSGGVKGVDVSGLTPYAAQQLVKNTLLPDAIKVGEFIALVRSEPKAKATPEAKATPKAKATPEATPTPKTNAEHFADILAGIRLISELSAEQVKQIAEEVAAKSAE